MGGNPRRHTVEKNQVVQSGSEGRRTFMKTTAGVAGGLMLPTVSGNAWAQQKEYPALGNYPAGVSGDTVTAGLTLDLTGPYSAEGAGQRRGFELAAAMSNNGDPRVRKVSPLTKQGILAEKVVLVLAHAETKPKSAVHAATRYIREA